MWDAWNKDKIVSTVHNFLGRNIIDDFLEIQDVSAITGDLALADYIADRAVAELEVIKSEAPNEQAFYELLKRIMLQSIDRLWMNHIDGMSKLREQVAFVWYAQKQPLMVYKEEAFKKFEILLSEIELRVVKSIFSINAQTQVEIKRVDDSKLQVNSSEIENMGMGNNQETNNSPKAENSWWNPLFVAPKAWNQKNTQKKKIRV